MIHGSFGAAGRPFVHARVSLTRLGVTSFVRFLVDTGADTTSRSARDWSDAGIDWAGFTGTKTLVSGYGGVAECPLEPARIEFEHEDDSRDIWAIEVEIAPPRSHAFAVDPGP